MTSDDQRPPKRERETIPEQWRRYGERPPLERWLNRAGMIAGALLVAAALVLAARTLGWLVLTAWRATGWS